MPDLSYRATGMEIMDDLGISGPDLSQALHELDGINYLLGGNYVTLNGILQLLEGRSHDRTIHIADLGCGSGDMLKRIRRLLQRRQIDAVLTGIDANPNVVTYAQTHTPPSCRIQYETLNILSEKFSVRKFDIVTATLFFHHFTDEQLIACFRALKVQASIGIVINDIHRHWFAYYSIKWLTRFFSRSQMVKHDAPLSVRRAFKKEELVSILRRAGIESFRIKWRWAFRWQVVVRF